MATFKGIKAGDRISFRASDGTLRAAQVNALLLFDSHVVVNHGNNGTVVDERNYLSHKTPRPKPTKRRV